MKFSSKSILSPSRSREQPQMSLSSSLSRRLGSSGSIKGGQASPMFPTGGRKGGTGFENPEPSSPKVTCIGQVRVKTRKQGKKMRARSKRRGEASFRKTDQQSFQVALNPHLVRQNSQSFQYHQNHQNLQQECLPHRNQRWVHLPLTICEALRAFGAEFSCFFPCRSSCMSSEREKEGKVAEESGEGHGREGSCGAAFARWLVTLQDGDARGREIELMMEEECRRERPERSQRRHAFEDIDLVDVEKMKNEDFIGEEEEKARVSICIPPKNALLLMRCRSDPVKMAALANRFWEPTVQKEEEDEDDDEDNGDDKEQEEEEQLQMEEDKQVQIKVEKDNICESEKGVAFVDSEEHVIPEEAEPKAKSHVEGYELESSTNPEINEVPEANQEVKEEVEDGDDEDAGGNVISNEQAETFSCATSPEVQVDLEKPETEEVQPEKLKEKENDEESSELASSPAVPAPSEPENNEAFAEAVTSEEGSTEDEDKGTTTAESATEADVSPVRTQDGSEPRDPNPDPESKERENGSKLERESGSLPECLLLMMCEPKVSMEVSKETWVCSTDFIRRLPEKHVKKTNGGDGETKKRVSVDSKPPAPQRQQPLLQPPRSSCSFPVPAGMSMATMIEQRLVGSNNGYEPFVLTRCKSEPMRSSAKLSAEACFWNNRKLEPHPPPATLGVGAAGVGF